MENKLLLPLKNAPRFVLIAGFILIVFLSIAYYLSTQVKKASTIPYFTFDAAHNKLEKTSYPGQKIREFAFTDQKGNPYSQDDIGHVVFVADYFFVQCPGICKVMASEMQRVYKAFENEPQVKILSYTSKPEEDSTEALMNYALRNKVKDPSKWVFLRGDKKELYKVAREQYVIVDEPGDGGEEDFIHTERFVLVDKEKYVRGYYDGTNPIEVDKLIRDMKELLEE